MDKRDAREKGIECVCVLMGRWMRERWDGEQVEQSCAGIPLYYDGLVFWRLTSIHILSVTETKVN